MSTDKVLTVEENLRRLVAKATKNNEIRLTGATTFQKLGLDSLQTVHILVALEDIYGIDLVDEEMRSIKDIGGFIDYVKKKVDGKKKNAKSMELHEQSNNI